MKMDSVTIFIAVCFGLFGLYQLADRIIVPVFNAYLQYKLQLKEMEFANQPMEINAERLQRDNDDPDSSKGVGKSSDGIHIHDEELPL